MTSASQSPGIECVYDVVNGVADAKGVTPSQLAPLYESIDPELIESVVRESTTVSELTFEHEGVEVSVTPEEYRISAGNDVLETDTW